jgi:hypothetical protein
MVETILEETTALQKVRVPLLPAPPDAASSASPSPGDS